MDNEKGYTQMLNPCITRRTLLKGSGAALMATIFLTIPGFKGKTVAAQVMYYPRKKIGQLSKLRANEPLFFHYPDEGSSSVSILVKLGEPAGGGIGSDQDVVAFNTLCPHMGGPLAGMYQKDDKALGPCPFHQSTFDLTRHGMIISGHATESIPQVLLELEKDDIYAVGMIGLIYGRYDNLVGET
ncbi:MAG: arsenate reductase (azurin) small subunit [Candidatus Tectomicrobia bacterium]|nr:arsenate reductase (azurin) small subunit [Candidatus Tectomicrobia bacterium]